MWKAATGVSVPEADEADDWETDPDFINDVSEHEQRWGPGGRNIEAIDMRQLRDEVLEADKLSKKKQYEDGPKSSFGYGGKFGVQEDRMDKSAVGHDYIGKTEKHVSQKDYAQGFGGKFGVQADRMDKSAVGHDYVGKTEKHVSQKDYAQGFGGKYGVQTDRMDASAVGHDYVGKTEKHVSQKDYAQGFGGKFGVQTDRVDKSAAGWEHHEQVEKHSSQKDYSHGFGGKFGVQSDRVDKSAVGWDHHEQVEKHISQKPKVESAKPTSIRNMFENMAKEKEQEALQSVQRIRQQREKQDKELSNKEKERQSKEEATPSLPTPSSVKESQQEAAPPSVRETQQKFTPSIEKTSAQSQPTYKQEPVETKLQEPELAPPSDEQSPNLPDVTMVGEKQELKAEVTRQPTVVVSPVGWEAETSEGTDNTDEEDGYTARALYDYQAAAADEISFDPGDVITNIVMIDEGWWQGLCKGAYGLFPANYVQLLDKVSTGIISHGIKSSRSVRLILTLNRMNEPHCARRFYPM